MATQTKNSIEVKYDYTGSNTPGEWEKSYRKATEAAAEEARTKKTGDLIGEIIRWQIADGYAEYMIVSEKPLKLQHINAGDGYRVDPSLIRGLRLVDVKRMVDSERRLRKLFSNRK